MKIFNTDLPPVFEDFHYEIKSDDIGYRLTWYVDSDFYKGDCRVWHIDTVDNPTAIKKMGYVTPSLSKKLDAVFLSYDEPGAEENFERLKIRFKGNNLFHVQGVNGIFQAHKQASELVSTDMFYVVDADSYVLNNWDFSFTPNIFDRQYVHIFRSRNAVNKLSYGNGGIKIFPVNCFKNNPGVDISTSLGKVKIIDTTISENRFNTSPFHAWRAGFREAAKLSSKTITNQIDIETQERLHIWKTVGQESLFGSYVIEGAIEGEKYGLSNPIENINNFHWLKEKYDSIYGST